jgi:prephenate dehydratase
VRVGYQGEELSYSHQAAESLFASADLIGLESFPMSFKALAAGEIERLVVPIENSSTGSVLAVLDRLLPGRVQIVAEHLVEVRHSLLGLPGAGLGSIRQVLSHPEALAQAETVIAERGWYPRPTHDTAGAVREVAELADPALAALAPEAAAGRFGLEVLQRDVIDQEHNTTRFVVVAPSPQPVPDDADKTSIAFTTLHRPGALALVLTDLGLRGANLTRIESRPSEAAWRYRFFVDLLHPPGETGRQAIFDPLPTTIADLHILGTYRAATHEGSAPDGG